MQTARRGDMASELLRFACMRLMTKLLALSGIIYAAILVDRRRRRGSVNDSIAMAPDVAVMDAEVIIGIAEVDPEPLSQMVEAMDPEATENAHRDVQEQRDRMPTSGKNVP
jgi:hypothetical protein